MKELIAWIVILIALTYMYHPLVIRLYELWKVKRSLKASQPSTLLGVVYPNNEKTETNK
jgi:antibiotic biosynthesis monooxygenase (ABM) superfamily enzyme